MNAATKIPIFVVPEKELRCFSPNFHIHVSVRDLYIPGISPHISCSRIGKPIVGIYKSITDTWMWKLGVWPSNSFSGNICLEFLVLCLCSEAEMKKRLYLRWPEVYQSKAFLSQIRLNDKKTLFRLVHDGWPPGDEEGRRVQVSLWIKCRLCIEGIVLKKSHVEVTFVQLQNSLAIAGWMPPLYPLLSFSSLSAGRWHLACIWSGAVWT